MTFWRWLFYLVQVGIVAGIAIWIHERPGHVSFVWLGHRVDTSMGVLLAALLILLFVAVLLHRLWRLVWRGPRDLARLNAERKRQQGYRALSHGMAAVAAGDAAEAKRQAKIANAMLKDPPLTLLLAAQTAQLGGDEDAARRYFTAMLEKPETAFLGLRGLLMQAMKAGDRVEALALARTRHNDCHRSESDLVRAQRARLNLAQSMILLRECLDALQEPFRGEGLGDIVARAGGQADVDVGVGGVGREQDDGEVTKGLAGPDLAQHIHTRHPGHRDVKDGQPRRVRLNRRKGSGAVRNSLRVETCLSQFEDQQVQDVLVIVGNEDAHPGRLIHARMPLMSSEPAK